MRWLALLALGAVVAPQVACTNDSEVTRDLGAACASHADCSDLCLPHPTWPNGFCSRMCLGDTDCSPNAVCVDTEEGKFCLFACNDARDCDFLDGPEAAWTCVDFGADAGVVRACGGE